jgi:hypothetical protein
MATETRTANVMVRMKPSMKAAAEKAAQDDTRSLSSLVEKLLIEHLKAKGYFAAPQLNDGGRAARSKSDAKQMAHVEIEKALIHSDEPMHVKEKRKRILTEVPADLKDRRPK